MDDLFSLLCSAARLVLGVLELCELLTDLGRGLRRVSRWLGRQVGRRWSGGAGRQ